MQDFEKLGAFYLGRAYDARQSKVKEDYLLYDSKDLVTHAVAVGMTGSGKTGLCIDLIEEAAIDGVPSILIDPKGDLANLMLTFPQLRPEDFLPWVTADDAARKGLSLQDYAAAQAGLWQKGLSEWGQGAERIQRLKTAADVAIYTPGSTAGIPVSIVHSFGAPPAEIMEDGELLQERISSTASSLLGLLGIQADPLRSREHILISTIFGQAWRQGNDLDLAGLIASIQNPPVTRIGVLELESFYPGKDRFELVMALNNLLASPGFETWLEGEPLDINRILYSNSGKPRVAIFSIAHLSDNERMFFVSMLLNQVLGWMRTQPGTNSLRALVYMDEIFGFLPPVANPPSKKPVLTLLKQARAFGVALVLATQNPVDLDYKALANIGTWFIGRLQTGRDKDRLMDGLEGTAISSGEGFDRSALEELISGLGNRVFLMRNVHEDQPVLFQTRWSLSYLRGPLTRSQIKQLMDPYKAAQAKAKSTPASALAESAVSVPTGAQPALSPERPALPQDVTQYFLPLRAHTAQADQLVYKPMLAGGARVHFVHAKSRLDWTRDVHFITPISGQVIPVSWEQATELTFSVNELENSPAGKIQFANLPVVGAKAKNYAAWSKDFVAWLYASQSVTLFYSPGQNQYSQAGESERDFRIRLQQQVREDRDRQVELARKKYASKIAALQEKVRKAEQALEREIEQANHAKVQTAVAFGATLLGAFTGRKLTSAGNISKASSALRGVGKSMQADGDIQRAEETALAYKQQLEELSALFQQEVDALEAKHDLASEPVETVLIKPKKTDIYVQLVSLVWAPFLVDAEGTSGPAW